MTKLKHSIEQLVQYAGHKAVVATHSMGSNVFLFFMKWVESESGGVIVIAKINTYALSFNLQSPLMTHVTARASMLTIHVKPA